MESSEEKVEETRGRKIIFWNIAGLRDKDRDVWKFLEASDFISLTETWVEQKNVELMENKLSDKWSWKFLPAIRERTKGRAKGGFLLGVRKEWIKENGWSVSVIDEGLVKSEVLTKEGKWTIWSIYNRGKIEEYWKYWEKMDFMEEGTMIIGGDFNIRLGEEGGFVDVEEEEKTKGVRHSKDKVIGNGGRRMIDFLNKNGWTIVNGNVEGDEEGEFTFTGARGSTVIDYVIMNERARNKIRKFKVEERIESDHAPISVELEAEKQPLERRDKKDLREVRKVFTWSEEDIEVYRAQTEEAGEMGDKEDTVEEKWDKIKNWVGRAAVKKERKKKKWKIGHKRWWDGECAKKKREVKKALKNWKKGEEPKVRYLAEREEWRKLCRNKEKEWRNLEIEKMKKLKNENEVWQYINGSGRKRSKVDNEISKVQWKEHFRALLNGANEKIVGQGRGRVQGAEEREKEKITEVEIRLAWKMLKKNKAAGLDEIPNEAWIYGGEGLNKAVVELLEKVWNGEGIPEDWKTGIIVPLHKKGDVNVTSNYRGITLLSTAYKIYTEVVRKSLVREVEEKGILPEGQAGFRKGRSTIDNIFVLDHLSQMSKENKEKLYAIFVDLKAAFDTVDRDILWKIMEEVGISKYLIERIKELYEETKVRVRAEDDLSEEFWTDLGLRQWCLLSPILFCIYICGLERKLKERNIGGVKIRNIRIWSLAYADDIVLLAKNREALLDMLETLRKFLKARKPILSAEKTKVMVFNKGRNSKKENWRWEGKEIEEVSKFKYLGFTFNKESNYVDHISELERKGNIAVRKVWGLGENKFSGDFKKRKMLFNYLVKNVMSYAVEIWGWTEKKELEKIQTDYLRWVLRLDFCTPRYIILKETDSRKLKTDWSRRAVKFELKIGGLGEERLLKQCWVEKMEKGEKDNYSRQRTGYYNGLGWSTLEIENKKAGENFIKEIEERESDIEKQILEGKIRESKYNKKYKSIMATGLPRYLHGWGRQGHIETLARVRCGNFEETNRYSLKEEDRKCKLCNETLGSWYHVATECKKVGSDIRDRINVNEIRFKIIADERGVCDNLKVVEEIEKIRKLGLQVRDENKER